MDKSSNDVTTKVIKTNSPIVYKLVANAHVVFVEWVFNI